MADGNPQPGPSHLVHTKKRVAYNANWKRNIRKRLRNGGTAYKTAALVEKRKRVSKMFTPKDFVKVVLKARPSQPFLATMKEDFIAFGNLARRTLATAALKIQSASVLKLTTANFGTVSYKTPLTEEMEWSNVTILKQGVTV